ncbi:MAG: Rieske 2Fe-2S domain-containing protein [Acidimicrobiales bacterium]
MTSDSSGRGSPATRRAYLAVVVALSCSILAGLGLAVVYVTGGQAQLEGVLLAVSLLGIGIGLVIWAQRFLPNDEVEEERGTLASDPGDVAGFTTELERGEESIGSRRVLLGLITGGIGALGLALLFPIRSLGPRPGRGLFRTAMADGRRLVNAEGEPVRLEDVPPAGTLTVWPEGHTDAADSSTLLIRVEDETLFRDQAKKGMTVGPLIAYSKLCTHTGCPVGLYQAEKHLLLCPCHQSTFEVLNGAHPVFGPAARPLPQLPLGVDAEGFIVAKGDFDGPVSAGFWDRDR